jgi:hypothetical protein
MLLFEHCVMMSSYVTVVYVNCRSWHVHGSHSVCLLKPGVTDSVVEVWWPMGNHPLPLKSVDSFSGEAKTVKLKHFK